MSGNADLARKWQRFHTVRNCLQQEMHSSAAVNLLGGINARIDAEAITLPKYSTNRLANPLLRYVGQGVIAASFFAMTIMATSMFNQSGTEAQPAMADVATNLDTPVLGGEYKGSELSRTASLESTLDEEALARLRQAVHQEFSGAPATPEIPVSYTFELPASSTATP
jgi:negative regulator of sigma E activity